MTRMSLFAAALLFVCGAFLVLSTEGSRILISAPHGTKSHQNMYTPLIEELANRGHHLTVISNYASNQLHQLDNVRQIVIQELAIDMNSYPNPFHVLSSPYSILSVIKIVIKSLLKLPPVIAEKTYQNPQVRSLLSEDHFDLVMVSQVAISVSLPIAWRFNAPIIVLGPNVIFPGLASALGDEDHYSYAPFFFTPFSDRMTFSQRMTNMISSKLFELFAHKWHQSTIRSIAQNEILPGCPIIHEIEKNVSLVFTNSHPSFTYPRTLPPQVIEVGGIHCRPPKQLPKDLNEFVSESEAGFILFAVGSAMRMEDMPEETVQSFINTFARLPQRVIWQWSGKPHKNLPKNVLVLPWLPQQDLLGHYKCKVFITHGGLNSIQEAIYHQVPILGLPFSTDQRLNMLRATSDGYALRLDWHNLNSENLLAALQILLHNSSYTNSVKKLSNLFRDQMEPPLNRAVYWTEFAIRHKGTDHLRLGSRNLSAFERNLIDVYFAMFIITLIPLLLTFFCLRKCCCGRRKLRQQQPDLSKKTQ